MESIPEPILLDILARLDTKSLLSLCLVSKLMHYLSHPLLYRVFNGHLFDSERSLKRLRMFSQKVQMDTSLAPWVRSIDVGDVKEPYIRELQDVFKVLLKHTPNLRHLCVPAGHFIKFLNDLLKGQNYLSELRSFETDYKSDNLYHPLQYWGFIFELKRLSSVSICNCAHWESLSDLELSIGWTLTPPELRVIPPKLQGQGDLPLRYVNIQHSCLRYTILACLIRSCKSLESFTYVYPSECDPEDSDPATIIHALLFHKNSLKGLRFDFRSRQYDSDGEDEDFDQVLKIESLEEFSCLEELFISQDCLPREPLLPPSLKVLGIMSENEPLEPDLFYNLGMASHSSLKLLSKLYVFPPPFGRYHWRREIFRKFNPRVWINLLED